MSLRILKKNNVIKSYLTGIALIFSSYAGAQIKNPIKWSYAAKKLNASEAILYIKADLEKGWHIYSLFQAAGGPEKTVFNFSKDKNYSILGKMTENKPIRKYEEVFGMDVHYFEGSVTFSQKIKLNVKEPFTIEGSVEYMACTDKECLPPREVNFVISVK